MLQLIVFNQKVMVAVAILPHIIFAVQLVDQNKQLTDIRYYDLMFQQLSQKHILDERFQSYNIRLFVMRDSTNKHMEQGYHKHTHNIKKKH